VENRAFIKVGKAGPVKFVKKLQKRDIDTMQARNAGLEPCTGIAVAITPVMIGSQSRQQTNFSVFKMHQETAMSSP
jgi:hypothetical protein